MKINNLKSVRLNVLFTSNNILCAITDLKGEVLFWTSTGSKKIRGTKKVTLTTITSILNLIFGYLSKYKVKYIHLNLKGFDKYKKIVLKYFKNSFLHILSVTNNSKIPHNGCKNLKWK
uniref:Ribosomal protein S11 n=1 Tax=Gracilaria vermiculophylla TaxID=2608709 RepID=A0A0F6N2F1_9FLOR|nr:ribosomal protein S11 [Gracilaria vermiculophylla]AHZ58206.1 ribosomal protein S11 [Gracilaria vermiculophylla]AHZ58231.1 ribosomal protein S11 [Gracilaria vermiculophylla]AXI97804.1 ribosomal protein S11 [Gracilaria vermiculophylla]WDZ68097.1 ribosomal protein S11 [Gracilaria vermiculophylla]